MAGAGEEVRIILGPTAAGKSAVAMAIAARFPVTIVTADSRQVYRGFDIGTAKPTADERRAVPHEGIDVAEPVQRWSAAAWAEGAERWIADARAAGREPVVVGGTGFYVRALVDPLFEEAPLDSARRAALDPVLGALALEELRRWATVLDPARAGLGRTQLLRALETVLISGRRLSDLHRERARAPRVAARYLVVDPGPALAEAIERRVRAMLEAGWLDEVRRLDATVPGDAPAWNATGYDAMRRHVRGEIDREAAVRAVVIATRQYAKRQRTWFRHQLEEARVTRVDPRAPDAARVVDEWWRGEAQS